MAKTRLKTIQNNLVLRGEILYQTRVFFRNQGYLEVETPLLLPKPIPEAHIDPVETESGVLLPSPEIAMKPLLASGYDRIFQITRSFRKNERGKKHLPEFTILEWYTKDMDYEEMAGQCQDLILHLAQKVLQTKTLSYQGRQMDITPPWQKMRVSEAFAELSGSPLEKALETNRFEEVLAMEIEPGLGWEKPLFLMDYPASMASLARKKPKNPEFAERFELYMAGIEILNAFGELTDPAEQRERFVLENEIRKKQGKKVFPLPEMFLHALKDMPEASGCALGIDRLVMIFADERKIDRVCAFVPEDFTP